MNTLVMFIAPVVAAFATATVLQKENKKSVVLIPTTRGHQKSGTAPVGEAITTVDAPCMTASRWQLGYSRQAVDINHQP